MLAFLLIRRQWRSAAVKREEVLRLISLATEESYLAAQEKEEEEEEEEAGATVDYYGSSSSVPPDVYSCAVCHYPTTTRCAQCKSVRYWFVLLSKYIVFFYWFCLLHTLKDHSF